MLGEVTVQPYPKTALVVCEIEMKIAYFVITYGYELMSCIRSD